ncbi:MAG TPA: DUF5666 domain-containing protein [Vicinamibacterales bacterium]|jgi:hypothetical protein
MNRFLNPLLVACVLACAATTFAQGAAKTARGTVTAIAADSITVRVHDRAMRFVVDQRTEAIAPGATHRTSAAQKSGLAGPKLADLIKVGQSVEVSYHDMPGMLHAARIRVTPAKK